MNDKAHIIIVSAVIGFLIGYMLRDFEAGTSILKSLIGNDSQWFWTMAQALIVLVSLVAIYQQIKLQTYSNWLQQLTNMRNVWESGRMISARKHTCRLYQDGDNRIGNAQGMVLGFFEELGLLLEKDTISIEFVWETYSYYIDHYWPICMANVKAFRDESKDPNWYVHFEYLWKASQQYSSRKGSPFGLKDRAQIALFIRGESE